MSLDQANDFLTGSSGRTAKFDTIGATHRGKITHSEVSPQTEFGTGKPLVWDDGKPRQQLVITIQTDEHDDDEDDGLRKLYAKGSKKAESKSMLAAIIVALGRNKLEVGGELAVKCIGERPTQGQPAKTYSARYEPPVAQPDGFDDDEEPF